MKKHLSQLICFNVAFMFTVFYIVIKHSRLNETPEKDLKESLNKN